MENLQLVQTKINSIKENTRFIKLAKSKRLEYYLDHASLVNDLSPRAIEEYNFKAEILQTAYNIEKLDYFKKHKYKLISGLERHAYAPELNKIYFRNNTVEIAVPKCNTIDDAIKYIALKQNLEQIKSI